MNANVSRRNLLKTTGVAAAAGLALTGLPLTHAVAAEVAEGNPLVPSFLVKPEPITDFAAEYEYDVVVVGAGESGLSAVHTALSIVYRAPQSGSSVEVPLSAKSDGVMAGTMEITDQTELGTWEARSIEWANSEGEERSVANTALSSPENSGIMMLAEGDSQDVLAGDEADLSGLTFEVVRPEELNPVPEEPGTPEEPSDPGTPSEPETPARPGEPQKPEVQVPAKPNPAKPGQAGIVQTGDGTPSVGLFAAMGGAIVALATAVLVMARKLARR